MLRLLCLLACAIGLLPGVVHGSCDVIPSVATELRSSGAVVDRPFAGPGDFVTIGSETRCGHAAAFSLPAAAQRVSVIFTPPGGPPHIVVLADECSTVPSCPGVATTCVDADRVGRPVDLQVVDNRRLRFRFPNTDALVGGPADALTLAGPATIAVTRSTDPIPCALANEPCAVALIDGQLLACVDALFADDGACGAIPNQSFPHFTALPFGNDFRGLCSSPSPPCTGTKREIRFALDTAGNVLVPMDWRGILVDRDAVPVPRLLRATTPP